MDGSDSVRPRILMCAKGWPPDVGGVQSYSEHVARAYMNVGYDVVVISSRPGLGGWSDIVYPEGVVRFWNVGVWSQFIIFIRMIISVRKIFSHENFTFIHATTWRPALALMPFRRQKSLVVTVHGKEILGLPWYFNVIMRNILRNADVVVAVSKTTLNLAYSMLPGGGRGRWIAAFNGLSYSDEAISFVNKREDAEFLKIYSFCRMVERKNISGALKAISLLKNSGIADFKYEIAGGGPLKNSIISEISSLDLDDVVEVAGYLSDEEVIDRYRQYDIFLHPQISLKNGTDIEGFGLVIADAMSFGSLVIVGKDGGPSDFVEDGVNGLIVDGNVVDEIYHALRDIIENTRKRFAISRNSREYALNKFSWVRHVECIASAI